MLVLPLLLAGCATNSAANEPPPFQPKVAKVVLSPTGQYVAVPPTCPDWSAPEANSFTNEPSSNYGCASQATLAQMVANPADLARTGGKQVADGDLASLRVRQYRAGLIAKSLDQKSTPSGGGGGSSSGSGAQN